jgi:hypothetical protein
MTEHPLFFFSQTIEQDSSVCIVFSVGFNGGDHCWTDA